MSYLVAKRLTKAQALNIECRYLEGSRMAWRLAEYHKLSDQAILEKICVGGVHVTLRKLLQRGGLSHEEIKVCAKEMKLWTELDTPIRYKEVKEYRKTLLRSRTFLPTVRKRSECTFGITYDYFRQEGLLDDSTIYIVDSGWVGSIQQTLRVLLNCNVEGSYFGLYELPGEANPKEYHSFLFSPYRDIERKVFFNNCLFEAICTSPKGMTLSYQERNERIVPLRETKLNPNAERIADNIWVLYRLLEDEDYWQEISKQSKNQICVRLSRVMSHPTREEAQVLGSYLFSDDINQSSQQELAFHLERGDLRNTQVHRKALLMSGILDEVPKDSAWVEGSIVQSDDKVSYHLWSYRWYKRLVYIRKWVHGHTERGSQ